MRVPRDVSGRKLVSLLARFGYQATRQTGSHIRLTSTAKGGEHHVTVPSHKALKVGTLASILREVARYLEIDRTQLIRDLFES